jgi:hypothetical protein
VKILAIAKALPGAVRVTPELLSRVQGLEAEIARESIKQNLELFVYLVKSKEFRPDWLKIKRGIVKMALK